MEFGLTGCSAVVVLKLLGVKCCVHGLKDHGSIAHFGLRV